MLWIWILYLGVALCRWSPQPRGLGRLAWWWRGRMEQLDWKAMLIISASVQSPCAYVHDDVIVRCTQLHQGGVGFIWWPLMRCPGLSLNRQDWQEFAFIVPLSSSLYHTWEPLIGRLNVYTVKHDSPVDRGKLAASTGLSNSSYEVWKLAFEHRSYWWTWAGASWGCWDMSIVSLCKPGKRRLWRTPYWGLPSSRVHSLITAPAGIKTKMKGDQGKCIKTALG